MANKNKLPRLIYIYSQPVQMGLGYIRCQRLLDALEQEFEIIRAFSFFNDEVCSSSLNELFQNQILPESVLLDPKIEVLFLEGHLVSYVTTEENTNYGIQTKISSKALKKFFERGGITIFDLFDEDILTSNQCRYKLSDYQTFLQDACLPFLKLTSSPGQFPDFPFLSADDAKDIIPYAIDEQHKVRGGIFRVEVTSEYLQSIHPPLRSAYEGVSSLLLSDPHPILSTDTKVVIAGNPTTRLLARDMFWDGALPIFGVMNDLGNGCGITITGAPFSDVVLEAGSSDAIKLLMNLLVLLQNNQRTRFPYLSLNAQKLQYEPFTAQALPFDIERFPQTIRERVPDCDEVIIRFIEEAIRCFKSEALLGTAFMLGAASEKAINLVINTYADSIKDEKNRERFLTRINNRMISTKYDEFLQSYKSCKSKPTDPVLSQDLETVIGMTFQFSRITRNQIGHPQIVPDLDRGAILATLGHFVTYIERIYSLMRHFRENGVVI